MSKYSEIENTLDELLVDLKTILTLAEMAEIQHFVDAGEYGLAFETLCGILIEEKKGPSEKAITLIHTLGTRMEIAHEYWSGINHKAL